jgi:glycosyltransferase involved in cell wall biosynthesis
MVRARGRRGQAPAISVIVPIRDRLDELDGLVTSLRRQTLPPEVVEVVIADDGSGPEVKDRLERESEWLTVLPGPPINSYAARNRALRSVHAPVIAFCDSDCKPAPDWLEKGHTAINDADIVAGAIRTLVPEEATVWTLLDIEFTFDQEYAVRTGRAATANLFVRRDVFEQVGDFDESLPSGGDYDFVERAVAAGSRLRFADDVVVEHPSCDGAWPYLRRMSWRIRWHATRNRRKQRFRVREMIPFVPLIGPLWERRQRRLSLRLDRSRLAEYGLRPTLRQELYALAVIYVLFPIVRILAGLRGLLTRA